MSILFEGKYLVKTLLMTEFAMYMTASEQSLGAFFSLGGEIADWEKHARTKTTNVYVSRGGAKDVYNPNFTIRV